MTKTNKRFFLTTTFALLLFMLMTLFCGCGRKSAVAETAEPVRSAASVSTTGPDVSPEAETVENLTDEQALAAIKNYCYISNPDLKDIVNAGEYPVYWDITSSDEHEIVVLFRSYTGAQNRYYIDRATGDTYVTEYVPEITHEEQPTDKRFNVRDYLPED